MFHLQARSSLGALLAVTAAAAGCSRSHDDQPTRYDSSAATSAALARSLGTTPESPPGDTTAQKTMHTLERLRTLKSAAFDTSFVNGEIIDHKHDIEDAHRMATAAQNPRVRTLVQNSLPVLQKHLDRAQQIAKLPATP